jgi:serine/threonine protein kinase
MADSNLGCKLANRYELLEPIGQGSMGRVYLAEDLLLGSVKVAIKLLSQTLPGEKMRDRFMQEAMTCAQLGQKSIHVVRSPTTASVTKVCPSTSWNTFRGKASAICSIFSPCPCLDFWA